MLAVWAPRATAGDRPPPPKLPLAEWWSVALDGPVSAGPVAANGRVYLAYASGALVARDAGDGHELWRQQKDVRLTMAADGDLLVVSSGDAVEALRGATGAGAWIVPRVKTVAPLVAHGDWVIATTDTEVLAIRAANGEIAWRRNAGGVRLAPALDGDFLYVGAQDGRLVGLALADGAQKWEQFEPGGITAIAAYRGLVYVGTGDKLFNCREGTKQGKPKWGDGYRVGAQPIGHIAVDDERVYFTALDNLVRAHDRENGNLRWPANVRLRPVAGVFASGHVVFVPGTETSDLPMLWDKTGVHAGTLALPGDEPPGLVPAIVDSPDGAIVYVVTGGLTNEWHLTKFAPAGEAALIPLADIAMPGLPYLTDPELKPIANVLQSLLVADPVLQPVSEIGWPVVLRDPPLVPLTTLPGLQLRPLSPVLPVRRGGQRPGA